MNNLPLNPQFTNPQFANPLSNPMGMAMNMGLSPSLAMAMNPTSAWMNYLAPGYIGIACILCLIFCSIECTQANWNANKIDFSTWSIFICWIVASIIVGCLIYQVVVDSSGGTSKSIYLWTCVYFVFATLSLSSMFLSWTNDI
jgi:hypothetical protein